MLKWALRIVAVSGALLAMAIGVVAWMHRTQGRMWSIATPVVCSDAIISLRYVWVDGTLRREWAGAGRDVDRFGVRSRPWNDFYTETVFTRDVKVSRFSKAWHSFGIVRGYPTPPMPSFTLVLCPTWALIVVLLLPSGLWAAIGWRQRRRVKAGYCAGCGYDLRASPERCPECGREVKK